MFQHLPDPKTERRKEEFRVGTLVYTKIGLMYLFIWLLWGDFCFTIMEFAMPGVLSVNIKGMGASNTITALFITTIPAFFNATVCPMISFKSDRMRTRWGRRIPILLVATPPIISLSDRYRIFTRDRCMASARGRRACRNFPDVDDSGIPWFCHNRFSIL